MTRRALQVFCLLALTTLPIGCGWPTTVDTTYGRTRGQSINGTGVFADILRDRGHEVRSAIRVNDALADWADAIVRFAPQPGPISRQEGIWLGQWLQTRPARQLIYVVDDFDTEAEFWEAVLASHPKDADPQTIKSVEKKRDLAKDWVKELPPRAKLTAEDSSWFEFVPKPAVPAVCQKLEGEWAEGIDAKAAAITKHEVFKVAGGEEVLLSGDGSPLAISWSYANGSRVLILANGSFLLNAALINHARRPLAMRVAEWIDEDFDHIAFLEGRRVAPTAQEAADEDAQSQFHILSVAPFGWIAVQFLIFLFLFAFSYAVRLGRPIADPATGIERPSAHPEALGALLAKTGRADAARFLLESYRKWRYHSQLAGRSAATPPPSPPR